MEESRLRQGLLDAGCQEAVIEEVLHLAGSGQMQAALQRMKRDRCRLLDEFHESGRRLDCLDYLIRQTQKEAKGERAL